MSLICIACGNKEFFETDVQTAMQLEVSEEGLLARPAVVDDWNYAEDNIREQVQDNVLATLKMHADELARDYPSGRYINNYLQCAVCHAPLVCRPFSDWQPRKPLVGLDEEMLNNRSALNKLRKERQSHENNLPVLWQP